MDNCFIYGASVKSRLLIDFMKNEERIDLIGGIIDGDNSKKGAKYYGIQIIGDIIEFQEQFPPVENSFCVSLSERNFESRRTIYFELINNGYAPASIISATAKLSQSATIEKGTIIFPECVVNAFAKIGRCVTLYTGTLVEHDCVIADNVDISPRCVLAGGVTIDENVFIGINATILPFVKIGRNAIVGAGSVVTKDVESNAVVAGNPARVLRFQQR